MGFIPPAGGFGEKRDQPGQGGFLPVQQELKKKNKKGFFFLPHVSSHGAAPLSYLSDSTPCLVLVLFPRGQFSHRGDSQAWCSLF